MTFSRGNNVLQAAQAQAQQKPVDTASDWKEFTSPDGRKYYHNRKTKESKWTMPEEMKRAQAAAAAPASAPVAAKPAAAAPPPVVKVPVVQAVTQAVAQTSSPTKAQKSPQVHITPHSQLAP